MMRTVPAGYIFYEQNEPSISITWRGLYFGFSFQGFRLSWPEDWFIERFPRDFIKETGWVEFGPIAVWYTSGNIAVRDDVI